MPAEAMEGPVDNAECPYSLRATAKLKTARTHQESKGKSNAKADGKAVYPLQKPSVASAFGWNAHEMLFKRLPNICMPASSRGWWLHPAAVTVSVAHLPELRNLCVFVFCSTSSFPLVLQQPF